MSIQAQASGKQDKQRQSPLWQDRDVRFDVSSRDLQRRTGEHVLHIFPLVEDTKGNSGDFGKLTLTNLRLIWQSSPKPKINLTIGLNCIQTISKKQLHSELRGSYNALHLMCKVNGTRYEFIFSQMSAQLKGQAISLEGQPEDLIYWLTGICRAYGESKFFRDLRLRCALFTPSRQLKVLPDEQIYSRIQGVWNLSSDQGNLGTMHLTDVRIIWIANLNELFNLSLPYVQVNSIRVRESKFGLALVIESSEASGGYVLGFKIDPPDRLRAVYNELRNLFNVHSATPNFGVEKLISKEYLQKLSDSAAEAQNADDASMKQLDGEGIMEQFVEPSTHQSPDVIAAYLADDDQHSNLTSDESQSIVYCPELGLSIEKIKHGYTLQELWSVIVD